MIIRPALVQDSRGIAVVHVSSWQHAYLGMVPQSYLDQLSVANRERRWVEIFERGSSETLVAEAAGHIVGFISYGNSRDEHARRHGFIITGENDLHFLMERPPHSDTHE